LREHGATVVTGDEPLTLRGAQELARSARATNVLVANLSVPALSPASSTRSRGWSAPSSRRCRSRLWDECRFLAGQSVPFAGGCVT